MKTRTGKRRDPVKEQFWRRTIADQARSGLSVRAFCEREGLEPWNFHWWRQALARRDREVPSARTVDAHELDDRPARPLGVLAGARRAGWRRRQLRQRRRSRSCCQRGRRSGSRKASTPSPSTRSSRCWRPDDAELASLRPHPPGTRTGGHAQGIRRSLASCPERAPGGSPERASLRFSESSRRSRQAAPLGFRRISDRLQAFGKRHLPVPCSERRRSDQRDGQRDRPDHAARWRRSPERQATTTLRPRSRINCGIFGVDPLVGHVLAPTISP